MMEMPVGKFFDMGSGIVTLCGSTKFFFEAMEANRYLTFKNWIVLQCGSWGHSFHRYSNEGSRDFSQVKLLHFHKIQMSQAIVVVSDSSNYWGKSTQAEIDFANRLNIPVFLWLGGVLVKVNLDPLEPPQLWAEPSKEMIEFGELNGSFGFE